MIYLDSKELQSLFLGNQEMEKVYFGDRLVWERFKVIALGYGTTFDVSNISGFENFSVNNFFVKVNETASVSDRVTGNEFGEDGGINTYLNKSYNTTTGIFSFNYRAVSDGGSVRQVGGYAFLIPELNKFIEDGKIIDLGTGTSWDIKALMPNKYQDFTIDNFAIQRANTCMTGNVYYGGTFNYSGYGTLSLNYNKNTGILTGRNSITMTNNGGGYINNNSASIRPFLLVK